MLAAFLASWRLNVLTILEYRANAYLWFAFTAVYHATAVAALAVALHTFPSMDGWNMRQMFFLYALWMMGHELHNGVLFGVVSVPDFIREGRFDRFLVRPLDALFQVITVPQATIPDGFLLAVVTFSFAAWLVHLRFTPVATAAVVLTVLGGAMIDFGISLAVATVAFWFVRVDALRWAVMSLEQEFTRYPLDIYSRGVQLTLTFILPFAFMNYYPASWLLHKAPGAVHLAPQVGVVTPLIGLACTSLAYAFWRAGLRRYQSTGS
jgi:ABC-2 type transport system permease protein